MQYRPFGRTGWQASALGLGCMRLPHIDRHENVNEPEAIRLIRRAIEGGVNYVDTAYGYHGGNSERVLGKALAGGWRDRVKVVTKLPPWSVKEAADFGRLFDEQISRLATDRIDLYLLHGLDRANWIKVRDLGVLDWGERQIARGRIGWLGFSFHDKQEVFREIVDGYPHWTACMIQYSYMDEERQAGSAGLAYAAGKGLAVVAMEPLSGGNLADPPASVRALWDAAPVKRSPVEWAFAWLWHKPELSVALSGMSTIAQVEENLAFADRSRVDALSSTELALVRSVAAAYEGLRPVPCTSCNYCMPCPSGVNIPHNFHLYNAAVMYNRFDLYRRWYADTKPENRASACTDCEQCEPKCPQKIVISDWMPCIDAELGTAGGRAKRAPPR